MPIVGNTSSQRKSVPNPPTIGTATGGAAQASVSFTPPTFDGKLPISLYTATSNPGSISATSTSTPVVVSNLSGGTSYTFTVTATNPIGESLASSSSNSVIPTTPSFFLIQNTNQGLEGQEAVQDSSGNIYYVSGSSSQIPGGFLTKYSQSGSIIWQRRLDRSSIFIRANGVRLDTASNRVIVAFSHQTGTSNSILAAYNFDGGLLWKKEFNINQGGMYFLGGNPYGNPLATRFNNYSICGFWENPTNTSYSGIFAKYNGTGQREFTRGCRLSGVSNPYNNTVFRSSHIIENQIYLAGRTNSDTSSFGVRSLVAKIDDNGSIIWAKSLQDSNSSSGQETEIYGCVGNSSDTNLYVSGDYRLSGGSQQPFIAKYNSSGTLQWQRFIGTNNGSSVRRCWSLTIDSSEDVYALLVQTNPTSLAIIKVSSSGNLLWQRNIYNPQSPSDFIPSGINISSDNTRLQVSALQMPANDGNSGPFLASLNADGSGTSTYSVSGFNITYESRSSIVLSTGNLTESTPNLNLFFLASTSTDSPATESAGSLTRQVITF